MMASIFAWNTRGFNKPRKHNAVKKWISDSKFSFGCLLETRVQEVRFRDVVNAALPGWKAITNYSFNRLGHIWVCWSDAVEVIPVFKSAQIITVWVEYHDTGDTFLSSFVYASNFVSDRRLLGGIHVLFKHMWCRLRTLGLLLVISTSPHLRLSTLDHTTIAWIMQP